MSKLRIIYIVSLVVVGVLLVFSVFGPITSGQEYSKVMRESIIQSEDEWIVQFTIINREGEDTSYLISWSTAGQTYDSKTVLISDGRSFTNIYHVHPETVKEGKLGLAIYKEGEATPFEQCTYYIQFD